MVCKRCELPDHECECDPIITTAHARYHVAHPTEGLIEHCTSRADAFAEMHAWVRSPRNDYPDKLAVTVYDVMARRGCAQLWGWFAGAWQALAYRL
jgi:hypothetical protein